MATKKKTKKKATKAKRTAGRKSSPAKKQAQKTAKKLVKRKATVKKVVAKKKSLGKRAVGGKTASAGGAKKSQGRDEVVFRGGRSGFRSGEQAGDLEGLSNVEGADSESVDELLEEGNAFEAGVVGGVEDAGEHEGQEVRTHEVPEDDVPGEYLDED